MKSGSRITTAGFFTSMAGIFVVVAMLTFIGAGVASAANTTSAGATIHNYVSVNYTSGTTNVTTYAAVDVKVLPVFAAPTVTTPANQMVVAGAAVSYTTTITTNSNGQDTLALTQALSPTGMNGGTPSTTFTPASPINLWGGLAVSVASQDVINLPGASLTGTAFLASIGSATQPTVMINGNMYTVTAASTGHIAATTSTGGQTSEQYDTITVSPLNSAPNITTLSAGTQILEYKVITYSFTAGTPSAAGTDGTYSSIITATSQGDSTQHAVTSAFVTTVQSPNLVISKQCWVNPTGTSTTTVNVSNYSSSCSAKPGQTIEYLITITNANSNTGSVASSVKVQDPVTYAYTTYVAGSTSAGNGTTTLTAVSDAGGSSQLVAGYTFGSPIAGGSTTASVTNQAFIVYRVTIN